MANEETYNVEVMVRIRVRAAGISEAEHLVLDLMEKHLADMLDCPAVETLVPMNATNPKLVAPLAHNWSVLGDGRYRVFGREFLAEVEYRREGDEWAFRVLDCNNPAISHDDIAAWCTANIQ